MADTVAGSFAGCRVLVTGGLGFIGSNLARRLADAGADVLLLDSLIPEYGGNLFNIAGYEDRVHVNISDVRDRYGMAALIRDRDVLFNLAGQTSHMDSMRDPEADLEINCHAQLSILEACRQHNPGIRIVFASTRQIYGRPDYLPVDEEHPVRPVDVNGINKLAGEGYHILYNNVYGIRTSVLRLTNTIGPRMRVKDARQTFLGVWVRCLLEGRPFEVWGGEQLRDFTYVDDVVEAFLLAASNEAACGRVFNLGGPPPVSLTELAELLIAAAGGGGTCVVKTFPEDRKRIDIGDYHSDWRRIKAEVGWTPRTDLPEALARTMRYYREHLARYV